MSQVMNNPTTPTGAPVPTRRPVLAVGPKLRKLLYVVFALFALLFANSAYLGAITFLEWLHGQTYEPCGMPGQSWNAAAFLLAWRAVQEGTTLFPAAGAVDFKLRN